MYSPKKTNKNKLRDNSVLKPETNSDSPSIKSKGTLEESERRLMNKQNKKGNKIKI